MNAPINNPQDFLQGQKDCIAGIPHEAGKSKDYDRGYNTQYQHEQNLTALSMRRSRYGLKKAI